MPETVDIAIVGGGVVGCAAAYYLAAEGMSVRVFEKDAIASHASGFAYGGLTPVMGVVIDDPLVPLSELAVDLHTELAQSLPEETGVDTQYRAKPSVMLATNEHEVPVMREAYAWLSEHHDGESRWLTAEDLQRMEPRLASGLPAGVYADISHEVEPYKFSLALAQAAEGRGAVFSNRAVTGLVTGPSGVEGVRAGSLEVRAETVLLAMGPWTGQASQWLGVDVPIEPLKGQIIRLAAPGKPVSLSLSWVGNYATTKPDGLLWAGTTEESVGFDEQTTAEGRDAIMESLVRVLPYLADARLAQHTACLRPVAPDGLPVIGAVGEIEGVYVATGAGRKGILLGPAIAYSVVEAILGREPPVDLDAFGLERFDDGVR